MSTLTLDLKAMQTLPPEEFMPLVCGHGSSAPRFCNRCRYEGWTAKQEADRAREAEAARRAAEAARAKEEADDQPPLYTAYMTEHYGPDPMKWARASLTDPEAQRLARALAN